MKYPPFDPTDDQEPAYKYWVWRRGDGLVSATDYNPNLYPSSYPYQIIALPGTWPEAMMLVTAHKGDVSR